MSTTFDAECDDVRDLESHLLTDLEDNLLQQADDDLFGLGSHLEAIPKGGA
ncbi:hypothetical protein [Streptomyces sp. NPDC054863]